MTQDTADQWVTAECPHCGLTWSTEAMRDQHVEEDHDTV